MQTVFVVLDTNTFLHYVSLEQIIWNDLFPDQDIILFICPPVIRELNKHKDAPRTQKLRDRAADVLRKIDTWAESSTPLLLRKSVELRFRVYDSNINFANHNLVRDVVDDHLVATVIELQTEVQPHSVVLLTKDTGLKLKARGQGILAKSLPDSALLPNEVLPSEKKIKELELQVQELQNSRPKLRLSFPSGDNKHFLMFQRCEQLSEADVAVRMTELRKKHPMMVEKAKVVAPKTGSDSLDDLLSTVAGIQAIPFESIRNYNESLEKFFANYQAYLEELADFFEWESRTSTLSISLVNDGSCPADDVDIFMHFPDGFEMFDKSEYEKEPEAPKAPQKPRSISDRVLSASSFGTSNYADNFPHHNLSRLMSSAGPSNVSGSKIKRTNSYDVRVNVRRAKHGLEVPLDVLCLTFETANDARSFTIDYELHAANLPSHVTGKLNVIVQ